MSVFEIITEVPGGNNMPDNYRYVPRHRPPRPEADRAADHGAARHALQRADRAGREREHLMPKPDNIDNAFAIASHVKNDLLNNLDIKPAFVSSIEDGTTTRHAEFYIGIPDGEDYLITVTQLGAIRAA